MNETRTQTVIPAAGGIVWRETEEGYKLALIHRPHYDDWSLPKGKLNTGETWQAAAIREVGEETGCEVEIRNFAGMISYPIDSGRKEVRFWNMIATRIPMDYINGEVDQILWLSQEEAVEFLKYHEERGLIAEQIPPGIPGKADQKQHA